MPPELVWYPLTLGEQVARGRHALADIPETAVRLGLDAVALPDALLANYLGGQASITSDYGRASFDERLAAPAAESRLLEAGRAEFIGVRANRRRGRWRDVPEWDVLILPTAADAEQATAEIAGEGGRAAQDRIFVRVLKRAGSGDRARAAEAALTRCLELSRRG